MRIDFTNLGQAGNGSLEIADLTIICGPNNSGKTYTSYAVFGLLRQISSLFDFGITDETVDEILSGGVVRVDLRKTKEDMPQYIKQASRQFSGALERIFAAPSEFFSETRFSFNFQDGEYSHLLGFSTVANFAGAGQIAGELEHGTGVLSLLFTREKVDLRKLPKFVIKTIICDMIFEALLGRAVPKPFIVTSERTGVALFQKDLDYSANAIISHMRETQKIDPVKLLEGMRSRYALPIQENIDVIRNQEQIRKRKSFLRESKDEYKFVLECLTDLLDGGSLKQVNGGLVFRPRKKAKQPEVILPIYLASSSVKSLVLVDLFINHIAQPNEILIIDEPELNLHPDNQVKIARLVARLVNAGVKVLVTTHSDYFLREINNLITLGSTGDRMSQFLERYDLHEKDLLNKGKVSAYCATRGAGLKRLDVTDLGVDTEVFDSIIAKENAKAQDIYFSAE